MKDRYFYPLALLVIAGIIVLALRPGAKPDGPSDADIAENGYSMTGNELERLVAAPGTLVSFETDEFGKVHFAALSSNLPRKMAAASAGVFATLGPQYERVFADKQLKITIVARAGNINPLEKFEAGYFTAGTGDSGWKPFDLGADYHSYSFTFTPQGGGNPGNDYVGIWPGADGKNKVMNVKSIRIEVLSPKP